MKSKFSCPYECKNGIVEVADGRSIECPHCCSSSGNGFRSKFIATIIIFVALIIALAIFGG